MSLRSPDRTRSFTSIEWVLRLARLALAAPLAWAVACGTAAAADDPAELRAACDAASHFSVLRPSAPAVVEARALWLDRGRLQWPGAAAAAGGQFRLLFSASGALVAATGSPPGGADESLALTVDNRPLPPDLAARFAYLAAGVRLALTAADQVPERQRGWHRGQLLLVQLDDAGRVQHATRLQHAAALDSLYAAAAAADDAAPPLGVQVGGGGSATAFSLWAPTALQVALCLYDSDSTVSRSLHPLARDESTGVWSARLPGDLSGAYYTYLVDVWVPGHGLLRQRVTDPYAISLNTGSTRAWVGRLDAPALMPAGWAAAPRPAPLASATEMSIYELHLRDFSVDDAGVAPDRRGKYLAFTEAESHGMRHLRALARAGLSDVHLLPVFDIASVPESGCTVPEVPQAAPDSLDPQAAVMAGAATDCYNWGYDPLHFSAPEGSYASSAADGAVRIREFRQMVMALHRAGLRVGMDVVYNHLSASGQHPHSVLDRIVPGYYHRLDEAGNVATSTCCANSATEHRMMARLMLDSVRLWARHYRIDSFRFDLMGHQPREAMLRLKALLRADNGREVQLIGEGWNFGEVADGARFVQASQRTLGGSGIATFSDRGRDALRGGGVGDGPDDTVARQGYLNGLVYDPNAAALVRGASVSPEARRQQLMASADLVRLALAGTLRSYAFTTANGQRRRGDQLVYAGQPAGYAEQPGEVVNYVENHDNHTLYDLNAFKLPLATPAAERARVQVLGLAFTAFSQGVAYFHAGSDLLRSKSMDGNSYDSGDWFNRIDWSGADNHFGSGLPPLRDNAALHPLIAPRLADPALRPTAADIAFTRGAFRDLLSIRASSRLLRLRSADEVQRRLQFHNTGPQQNPVLIAVELDGRGLAEAGFGRLLLLFNVDKQPHELEIAGTRGQRWQLHPVHLRAGAADRRPRDLSRFDRASGRFAVPARTAVVYALP